MDGEIAISEGSSGGFREEYERDLYGAYEGNALVVSTSNTEDI